MHWHINNIDTSLHMWHVTAIIFSCQILVNNYEICVLEISNFTHISFYVLCAAYNSNIQIHMSQ